MGLKVRMTDVSTKKTIRPKSGRRCPLCNSLVAKPNPLVSNLGYLVCSGCFEILEPRELVRRATRRTSRAYAVRNGYPTDYWKTGEPR